MDGIELDPSLPLSALSYKFRTLVSNLLNTKRVLTTDGPTPLLRDWRGLACLLQISSELAASIGEIQDKTGRLLEIWTQKGDGTATLGTLLQYLIQLDRYDVHDDIIDLAKQGQLLAPGPNQDGSGKEVVPVKEDKNDSMILTHDDRRDGVPNFYHAYVLFAQEDWSFVRELLARMRASGFKLCTEYDIDVGYATQYAPVAQLILERCYRIILVYSPAFIDSPANTFYSDYAQAVGIESNKRNIIPIIYRDCKLPHNLMYYHRLVYKPQEWAPYDFWKKLAQTLEQVKLPTSNGALPSTDTTSTTVTELESSYADAFLNTSAFDTYSTGDTPQVEISQLKDSSSTDSSQASSEKKKTRSVTKVFRFLRGKTKVYG